jgi:predicted acylesterase/phospholipase RssA
MDESVRKTVGFAEIFAKELQDIEMRRERALDWRPTPGQAQFPLVGLALSGGGIRSGAVSLGLLQALYEKKVLSQIDYVSTVSGGGYAGGYLSANLEEFNEREVIQYGQQDMPLQRRAGERLTPKRLSLAIEADGNQGDEVLRLIHGGVYLRKLRELLNATLFGMVVNVLMLCSGLLALSCLLALGYRSLDEPTMMNLLSSLGFRGDVLRPLFPSAALFALWVFSHFARGAFRNSRMRSRLQSASNVLAVALTVSLLLALGVVLNTSDISITNLRVDYNVAPDESLVKGVRDIGWFILVIGIVLALLPYLRRKDLLRSGTHPTRPWEPWVVRAAGWAMLAGVPLLLFGFVVRENLFNYNAVREDRFHLVRPHIDNWPAFWRRMEIDARGESGLNQRVAETLLAAANGGNDAAAQTVPAGTRFLRTPVAESILLEERLNAADRSTWWFERPFFAASQFRMREHLSEWKDSILDRVNRQVLDDPHTFLAGAQAPEPLLEQPRKLAALVDEELAALVQDGTLEAGGVSKLNQAIDDLRGRLAAAQARANVDRRRGHTTAAEEAAIAGLLARTEHLESLRTDVRHANRDVLGSLYGKQRGDDRAFVRDENVAFALLVLGHDQRVRVVVGAVAVLVFGALGCLVNVNHTSAHTYYTNRLAEMWIYRKSRQAPHIPLTSICNTDHGGPYHLINATVNLMGPRRLPNREPTDCFLFSRRYCGSQRVGFENSRTYRESGIMLADAMAISGAAVSPLAVTNNPLLFYTMLLINARLGQWAPNPGVPTRPTPAFVPALLSYFQRVPEESNYLYLSDGGHHDNTGIESLLVRRCRVIIACDASFDNEYQFLDFLRLMRRMEAFHGIRFELADRKEPLSRKALMKIVPDASSGLTEAHFIVARIYYPDAPPGWLLLVKSSLTGREPAQLALYKQDNKHFPHDPTLDQFYDPRRFECYRALGWHMGADLCSYLNAFRDKLHPDDPMWLDQFEPVDDLGQDRPAGPPLEPYVPETAVPPTGNGEKTRDTAEA